MFGENLDIFLRDFGAPCTVAGQPITGILNQPDDQMLMAGVNILSTMYALTVKTADVTAQLIKSKTVILINTVSYEVRDVMLQDDGSFTILTLSKS
jgi:hypothetical protein